MNWKEFETVVRWIYETMGKQLGVEVLGHGPKCRHLGKSQVYHQIDVLQHIQTVCTPTEPLSNANGGMRRSIRILL